MSTTEINNKRSKKPFIIVGILLLMVGMAAILGGATILFFNRGTDS